MSQTSMLGAHLDALDTTYEIVEIDPAYSDTAQCCEKYGFTLEQSLNCIIVAAKTEPRTYAACLVQATRRLDVNGTVRRLLGARKVSFATADETTELTGMAPGGVTPFGLPPQVPIYLDAASMTIGNAVLGGGSRDQKVILPVSALGRLPGAVVVEDLSKAIPTE